MVQITYESLLFTPNLVSPLYAVLFPFFLFLFFFSSLGAHFQPSLPVRRKEPQEVRCAADIVFWPAAD